MGTLLPPSKCLLLEAFLYPFTLIKSLLHKALNNWGCIFGPRVNSSPLETTNLTPFTVSYQHNTLMDLWITSCPSIAEINPSWSLYMSPLMYFWIWFANIFFWEFLLLCSLVILPSCLCVGFLCGFSIRMMLALQNEFESVPSSLIFWNSFKRIGITSLNVHLWNHMVQDFCFFVNFLCTTDLISLLAIGPFIFSFSSWFSFRRLYVLGICSVF